MAHDAIDAWTAEKEAEFARSTKWTTWPTSLWLVLAFGFLLISAGWLTISLGSHAAGEPLHGRILGAANLLLAVGYVAVWRHKRSKARLRN